jgi:hypothetical protein
MAVALVGLLGGLIGFAREWVAAPRPGAVIDLSPWALPKYTFFSLVRGLLAYLLSLSFTIVYGYWAAKDPTAEQVLILLLDVLQSIPVLGFMPGLVLAMTALFPSSHMLCGQGKAGRLWGPLSVGRRLPTALLQGHPTSEDRLQQGRRRDGQEDAPQAHQSPSDQDGQDDRDRMEARLTTHDAGSQDEALDELTGFKEGQDPKDPPEAGLVQEGQQGRRYHPYDQTHVRYDVGESAEDAQQKTEGDP